MFSNVIKVNKRELSRIISCVLVRDSLLCHDLQLMIGFFNVVYLCVHSIASTICHVVELYGYLFTINFYSAVVTVMRVCLIQGSLVVTKADCMTKTCC